MVSPSITFGEPVKVFAITLVENSSETVSSHEPIFTNLPLNISGQNGIAWKKVGGIVPLIANSHATGALQ